MKVCEAITPGFGLKAVTTFIPALLLTCALYGARAQTPPSAAELRESCEHSSCYTVRVQEASTGKLSNVIQPDSVDKDKAISNDISVTDGQNFYQLTCSLDSDRCKAPPVGVAYKMLLLDSEKPQELEDFEGEFPSRGKLAYLFNSDSSLGPYWLVTTLPDTSWSDISEGVEECKSKEAGSNTNDCVRWVARKHALLSQRCSDPDSSAACESLIESLRATDPDLLDLLSRMQHIYLCPHPGQDTFFVAFFSEPLPSEWRKPSLDDEKLFHVGPQDLEQFGLPGIMYFEKGINEENDGISDIGMWRFMPLSRSLDENVLARVATSADAKFRGRTISIEGSEFSAVERYKSKTNKDVQHRISIQRSTGRFTDTYEDTATKKTFLDCDGRCFIAPDNL